MARDQLFGLFAAKPAGIGRRHQEGVEPVDVAARGQHIGIHHHIAAGGRLDIAAIKRVDQRAQLIRGIKLGGQQCAVRGGAIKVAGFHHRIEHVFALGTFGVVAQNVQSVRDQRRFHFVKARGQFADVGIGDIECFALIGDQ